MCRAAASRCQNAGATSSRTASAWEFATDRSPFIRSIDPALAGALCCGGFLFLGSRSGLARHYLFIGASLAGGLAFSLIEFDRPYENVQMFLLAMAALMVVSGSLIFIRFIRTHPLAPAGSGAKEVNEHS